MNLFLNKCNLSNNKQYRPVDSMNLKYCSFAANCNIPTNLDEPFKFVISSIKF